MKKILPLLVSFYCTMLCAQSEHDHRLGRALEFPDIPAYKTLKCDFHQHTVFSDGQVWPNIRVMEALMDGLDAISLTEHLEYQPHKADIPHPDRNRSHEIALQEAKDHDLIIVRGSEITRSMPPGHNNAIFLEDNNKLLIDDSVAVFKEAKKQGAFVFWNHPAWVSQRPDGVAKLTDMHKMLIKEELLNGIEVVNMYTYSDEALQIALDNNMTIMGTSDIHGLIDWDYEVNKGGHRPVTLVFAKERNADAIKEGLENRRTVVSFNDLLIGRDEFLIPLIESSLKIKNASYSGKSNVLTVTIENLSSTTFSLKNKSDYTFHDHADLLTIKPGENTFEVKTIDRLSNISLSFEVLNAVNVPKNHPLVVLKGSF
ncbi:Sb-PDE family phosphodiesterase [Galbibacter sp. EGI 63066]|uniref:Sb-PDE family phosphodiesterase n=1 Tax=Galbibacter sp. EGI 63066 TaxID=2993559 RepID=UPI0022494F42|nr:Sb-PDE family phosphodiesterase [Galbibacter sp. EGI 63066]MCX2680022.1 Sb-PDE family phosphodiesterase [Galbibacter sp. EGI 63066]